MITDTTRGRNVRPRSKASSLVADPYQGTQIECNAAVKIPKLFYIIDTTKKGPLESAESHPLVAGSLVQISAAL